MNSPVDNVVQSTWQTLREVELFLFREAELADTNQYEQWLSLWTEELLYWVPCNADELDPQRKISIIYDERPQLENRIFRLGTKHAYAQRPQSRLTRLVSNIVLEDYDSAMGGWVSSRFVAVEMRHNRQTLWSGRVRHRLARAEGVEGIDGVGGVKGALRIREKHVFLLNNDTPMGNMTFII